MCRLHSLACLGLFLAALPASAEDFASVPNKDAWLRHPVYGDASFDNFTHHPGNPVLRGAPPLEWPVNGFLFEDPVSTHWFLYVGHYPKGYAMSDAAPFSATVYRSEDRGKHWTDLGSIFPPEEHTFEGETSPTWYAPDVSVLYDGGKYHLAYDWATRNTAWSNAAAPGPEANNGSGYARAERPEGPYHRTARPVADTRSQPLLLGKYKRLYASTIVRRAKDWVVLVLTDSGPHFGWGYLGFRADRPEGPYDAPVMLLHPEKDGFHPPLMEFHPSFVHDGHVYAPATSVARNRNFQMIWRAPLERMLEPGAWEIVQHGSVWHAEPVEHEAHGIWGQAFSGFIGSDGAFNVMYPARDSEGMGTINIASRPWTAPFREQGFVVSGHQGASMVRLKRAGAFDRLALTGTLHGKATVMWNARGPLGPDAASSDATLHALMRTAYGGIEISETAWALVDVDAAGTRTVIAEGALNEQTARQIEVMPTGAGQGTVRIDGVACYAGALPQGDGTIGLLVEPSSHLFVERFEVDAAKDPARVRYLYTEALLGAAQKMADWEVRKDAGFLYGTGAISTDAACVAKWNFEGTGFSVYAPAGPELGTAEIRIDGAVAGTVDLRRDTAEDSAVRFSKDGLTPGFHAVTVRPAIGRIAVDVLEVVLGVKY
ncbi:MAG: hypothetical protein HYV27_06045 [Candidatus Hydrogenedentes bacterium]|nr:hypothetical protein [Candidatus Hydrogenedentota bacterium]